MKVFANLKQNHCFILKLKCLHFPFFLRWTSFLVSVLQVWRQPNDPSHAVEVLETGKVYLLDASLKRITSKQRLDVVKISIFLFFAVQVTCGFQTTNMLTALPNSFLDPLLSFALLEDAEIRLLVLEILVSLIDRHDNLPKFSTIRLVSLLHLGLGVLIMEYIHIFLCF